MAPPSSLENQLQADHLIPAILLSFPSAMCLHILLSRNNKMTSFHPILCVYVQAFASPVPFAWNVFCRLLYLASAYLAFQIQVKTLHLFSL